MKIMFSKTLVFAVIVFFIGAGVVPSLNGNKTVQTCSIYNDDELDQEQTNDCNYGYRCFSQRWFAQEFIPSTPLLTRVQLEFFRHGNPSNDIEIIMSIRDEIFENDLFSSSLKARDIYGTHSIWIEFDFPDIEVTPENNYYIVCKSPDANDTDCFAWYIGKDEQYPQGRPLRSWNEGENWEYLINYDMGYENVDFCFKSYGRGYNPYKPDIPKGPHTGKIGKEYNFSTNAKDPLYKQLSYLWDWGDGTTSDWIGSYDSGEIVTNSHTWSTEAEYSIRVKAKNSDEEESLWSDPLSFSTPKNKAINTPFLQFLENHPYLFPILRQLLGL